MKSSNEIKKRVFGLNEFDEQKIKQILNKLSTYKRGAAVSLEGLKTLYNIQTELLMFTEQYSDRLISLLKQNHMVD